MSRFLAEETETKKGLITCSRAHSSYAQDCLSPMSLSPKEVIIKVPSQEDNGKEKRDLAKVMGGN